MRLSITRNLTLAIVVIVLVSFSSFFVFYHFLREGFESHVAQDMKETRLLVEEKLSKLKERLYQEAVILSNAEELAYALRKNDITLIKKVAKRARELFQVGIITITDTKGTVLARGGNDRHGDSLAPLTIVCNGLQGTSDVDIIRHENGGLAVVAAAPLSIDGKFTGLLLVGEDFHSHDFVDEIKLSRNHEMTVFDNNVSLSTTLVHDGRRAVGTVLEDDNVRKAVLLDGKDFHANATILGKFYKTVYWPLQNNDGMILGMWFIGLDMENVKATVRAIALVCLASTLFMVILLAGLGAVIVLRAIAPLTYKAYMDMLTGILNRAGFEKALRATLKKQSGTLFLLDLDNFKEINDNLGHPTGDECLKRVAVLLKEVFQNDIVARLGGDEFIVFSPTLADIKEIKEKARQFIEIIKYTYRLTNGEKLTVTTSIGIAICPIHGKTYTPLYNNADSALYAAKNNGRNRYIIFSEDRYCSTRK